MVKLLQVVAALLASSNVLAARVPHKENIHTYNQTQFEEALQELCRRHPENRCSFKQEEFGHVRHYDFGNHIVGRFARNEINYYDISSDAYLAKVCPTCPIVHVYKICHCFVGQHKNQTMTVLPPKTNETMDIVHYGHPKPMHPDIAPGIPLLRQIGKRTLH